MSINEKKLKDLVEYKGRKPIEYKPLPKNPGKLCLASTWDGGTKDYWSFVSRTGQTIAVPENGNPNCKHQNGDMNLPLATITFDRFYFFVSEEQVHDDVVLVNTGYFCGKQTKMTVYVKSNHVL